MPSANSEFFLKGGAVTPKHLELLWENKKFLDKVSQKLSTLGYAVTKFAHISAVTETIEDLVLALDVYVHKNECDDDTPILRVIYVKLDTFEVGIVPLTQESTAPPR